MSKEYKFFATTPLNIEDILALELEDFGATAIKQVKAGVHFSGSLETAYKACLWSRTANRILFPIKEFTAESKEQLYDCVKLIKWEKIISIDDSFAVSSRISKSKLVNERFASLVVKDALVDYFRELSGKRPDVAKDQPKNQLNLHVFNNQATLSLDLSGDSLHRRGYRLEGSSASLKENTAAAMLYRSRWKSIAEAGGAFVDPMCGGATLPIEAALIAGDIAPGLFRSYFGFFGWLKHNADLWEDLWDEAEERKNKGKDKIPFIVGYDQDGRVIARAIDNIKRAGLSNKIHVEKKELSELKKNDRWEIPGLITINPPYGERLGEIENLRSLYRSIGDIMKERFQGWKMSMITSSPELSKSTGLKAEKINTIYNGSIKCILANFSINILKEIKTGTNVQLIKTMEERFEPAVIGFINRLNKRRKHLAKWAKRKGVSCYRVYDADLPDYNVAIDTYENKWIMVSEYAPPKEIDSESADKRIKDILTVLPEVFNVDRSKVFLKTRRRQSGKSQYNQFAKIGSREVVHEEGSSFWVNTKHIPVINKTDANIFISNSSLISTGRLFLKTSLSFLFKADYPTPVYFSISFKILRNSGFTYFFNI